MYKKTVKKEKMMKELCDMLVKSPNLTKTSSIQTKENSMQPLVFNEVKNFGDKTGWFKISDVHDEKTLNKTVNNYCMLGTGFRPDAIIKKPCKIGIEYKIINKGPSSALKDGIGQSILGIHSGQYDFFILFFHFLKKLKLTKIDNEFIDSMWKKHNIKIVIRIEK